MGNCTTLDRPDGGADSEAVPAPAVFREPTFVFMDYSQQLSAEGTLHEITRLLSQYLVYEVCKYSRVGEDRSKRSIVYVKGLNSRTLQPCVGMLVETFSNQVLVQCGPTSVVDLVFNAETHVLETVCRVSPQQGELQFPRVVKALYAASKNTLTDELSLGAYNYVKRLVQGEPLDLYQQ